MGFDIPKDNDEWARDKGLIKWCEKHKIRYNPMIGCPEHLKEIEADKVAKSKKLRKQGKDALDSIFGSD